MRQVITPDIAALFAASEHISLFIWENSPSWPVLHCTDNVRTLLGYSKEDFHQRRVTFSDLLHPQDSQRVSEEVKQAIATPDLVSFTHEDYRLIRADGREVWVADTTLIDRSADGQARRLIGYMLDITARKNLELALIAERRHLQMVLEGTRLGSWEWNLSSDLVRVNQRWLNMYGQDDQYTEVTLSLWESLVHPDDREGWHKALQLHVQAKTPFYEHIYRMRHARGHYLHVLDRGKVVERSAQKGLRFSGTHTDISKQKEAELEARKTASSRTLFLANLSHEIRTPLHGILGLASVLAGTELNASQRELLDTIEQSGEYLVNTLNDAIDISRADEGKMDIRVAPHSRDDLLTHLRSLFSEQATKKALDYQVRATPAVPVYLELDKSRVMQIAINLINNAFKFTRNGHVHVVFDWRMDNLYLQVDDSGVGIADTEKIWRAFEREYIEPGIAESGGGLGLGIVHSLVKLMNGQVDVQSVPGEGSCFTLSLPVRAASEPKIVASSEPSLPAWRALIIDDNDINQLILGEMLNVLDLTYVSVSSAEIGLQVLQQQTFDVVFMDIHMPDIGGIEATRRIRSQRIQQPHIIGLTANAALAMKENALSAGMDAYLTKPFDLDDIQRVLAALSG